MHWRCLLPPPNNYNVNIFLADRGLPTSSHVGSAEYMQQGSKRPCGNACNECSDMWLLEMYMFIDISLNSLISYITQCTSINMAGRRVNEDSCWNWHAEDIYRWGSHLNIYLCLTSYLYLYIIGDHFQSVLPYVRHNDER